MPLLSREQRDGQPLACAYGCTSTKDDAIRAGLLFVRDRSPAVLTFDAPTGPIRLRLPADYVDLKVDGWGVNETLRIET